jgi:hypothetical protein
MSAGRAEINTQTLRGVISHLKSLTRTLEELVPSALEATLPKTQRMDYLCRSHDFAGGFAARGEEKEGRRDGAWSVNSSWQSRVVVLVWVPPTPVRAWPR